MQNHSKIMHAMFFSLIRILSTQLKHLVLLAMFMFSVYVCTQITKQKRVQVSPNDGQTKIDVAYTLCLSTQTRMEVWNCPEIKHCWMFHCLQGGLRVFLINIIICF